MEPTFSGIAIFGPAPSVRGRLAPPARTFRAFNGVNGVFSQKLGTRGAEATASGILQGETLEAFNIAVGDFFDALADGGAYDLVDSAGVVWPRMILVDFQPGDVMLSYDGYFCEYQASFRGLTLPTG